MSKDNEPAGDRTGLYIKKVQDRFTLNYLYLYRQTISGKHWDNCYTICYGDQTLNPAERVSAALRPPTAVTGQLPIPLPSMPFRQGLPLTALTSLQPVCNNLLITQNILWWNTHWIMGDFGITPIFKQAWFTTKCESQITQTIITNWLRMHHQHMNSVHLTELQQKYIICLEIKIQSVCNLFNTLSGIPALTCFSTDSQSVKIPMITHK